ncbi:type 2 lantibiotic biosynthesis protein LanM [compost metagenome]
MLVSQVVGDFASNQDDGNLRSLGDHVGRRFASAKNLPSSFLEGMCEEVYLLLARMCSPMMAAIQQAQGDSGRSENLASWIQRELGKCTALDSALSVQVQQVVDEFSLAWARFRSDHEALQASGLIGAQAIIADVRIASPDKHHGQHVLKFSFLGTPALFYKPRPGSGAALLQRLARTLSEWGFWVGAAPTVDFGSHHWMAEISYSPKLSGSEALQYAYNGGVLYGLATLLNASDLHFENIIASPSGPVVVDCETLCQPKFSRSAASHLLKRPYDELADGTSLFLNLDTYCGQPIDYGGLSCVEMWIRKDPYEGLQVLLDRDTRELTRHSSRSAVEVNGLRIAPAVAHFDRFVDGFAAFGRAALNHKKELLSVVDGSAQFRIPLRATRVYAAMVGERLSAIYFSSYANHAWSRHLELELETVEQSFLATARAILEAERREVYALDIPVGYVRAGSRDLLLGGAVLEGVFELSPAEMIQRRLDSLCSQFIDDRIALLRSRLLAHERAQLATM